ncbi:MAG: hypothetical protein B5M51_04935 [Anaerolinea sp. 4484_236]|nr:MAG: hypothetical protein B5M51_04935 [Anaerolinea sp. 4484_236]
MYLLKMYGRTLVVAQLGRHKALPLPRIIEMILNFLKNAAKALKIRVICSFAYSVAAFALKT